MLASREKQRAAFVTGLEKSSDEAWKAIDKQEQAALEEARKLDEEMGRQLEKSVKDSLERSKQQADKARQAGDSIGSAFVNALADQLGKLAGGEFDAAIFIGDVLATAVSVAAGVIGSACGMPALGAAVEIAATGIRAGSSALRRAKKARTAKQYHAGGWVGDEISHVPRFHTGTWIGRDEQLAILQHDERVASKQEVRNAGGPAALDAVLSGKSSRPGVVVNISAIDSKSAAESFESDLADGMRRAQRAGRGMLPALLGRTPMAAATPSPTR